MESKRERKKRTEMLERLSAHEMSMEELIESVMAVDPKPLWDQEKREREEKEMKKTKKKRSMLRRAP